MTTNNILKKKWLWLATAVVFILLLVFFDRNSFVDRKDVQEEITTLREQRDYYLDRIREDSMLIEKLKDDAFLEQYARENFLMKRDSDVVYVMEPKPVMKDTTAAAGRQ